MDIECFKIKRAPPCAMPDEFKVLPRSDENLDDQAKGPSEDSSTYAPDLTPSAINAPDESELPEMTMDEEQERSKQNTPKSDTEEDTDELNKTEEEEARADEDEHINIKLEEKIESVPNHSSSTLTIMIESDTTRNSTNMEETIVRREEVSLSVVKKINDHGNTKKEEGEEFERIESLLAPLEDEVAASEVAFPLYVYQSYRAYYLGTRFIVARYCCLFSNAVNQQVRSFPLRCPPSKLEMCRIGHERDWKK